MELERVARRCHRLKVIVTVYSTMVVITVILPTLVAGRPSMPVWPYPNSGPALTVVLAAQVGLRLHARVHFISLPSEECIWVYAYSRQVYYFID